MSGNAINPEEIEERAGINVDMVPVVGAVGLDSIASDGLDGLAKGRVIDGKDRVGLPGANSEGGISPDAVFDPSQIEGRENYRNSVLGKRVFDSFSNGDLETGLDFLEEITDVKVARLSLQGLVEGTEALADRFNADLDTDLFDTMVFEKARERISLIQTESVGKLIGTEVDKIEAKCIIESDYSTHMKVVLATRIVSGDVRRGLVLDIIGKDLIPVRNKENSEILQTILAAIGVGPSVIHDIRFEFESIQSASIREVNIRIRRALDSLPDL